MLWPSFADYELFIKNAFDFSVLDPVLRNGQPMRGISGGFSRVYPVKVASKTFALRCWVKDVGNAKIRYEKISSHLTQISLPYFVDFKYVPEGVLINNIKYPITRMEWADGVSLRKFIEQNLRDARILKVVTTEFQKMVTALHKHQVAHGDLQSGNILLKRNGTNVEIKLIDYDSLFVPMLQGQSEQILGLPEYQHPLRIAGGGQASKKVDYFSELVIYLSFLSLAEKPELWNQFKDKTERGLLFSKEDFENPDQSDIFYELEQLSPDVQQLAATLKDFCTKTSIDQLKPLEAILPKSDANTHTNRGHFFLEDRQYDEALAEFQNALTLNSRYDEAHRGMGLVYLHTRRYPNAVQAFQQATQLNANYKEAHHGLALAYFRSGDNRRATAAANAALRIDPHYQPARQLLDAINAMPPPVPPQPPGPVPPPPDPTPKTGNPWYSVTAVTLGLALVICFIAFLTQMDAKDTAFSQKYELTKQLAQKESEIRQKGLEIQGLTSSVQTLESANQKLGHDNSELRKKLNSRTSTTNATFGDVRSLRRQISDQIDENQELQAQLIKKDAEIQQLQNDKVVALNENQGLKKQLVGSDQGTANQTAIIQRLQREKTETLTKNRRLQAQLAEETLEAKNLTNRVQQLQNEKAETQRQNQKLQGENADITRQNRNLRNENEALRNQLGKSKQENSNEMLSPELPKKIQDYRDVVTRAGVYNNHGIIALERKNYVKAIGHFREAIKTDSKFDIAHYNLGCTFLEMKEYRNATSAFNKVIALNQKFKEAYYNRSLAYFRTKRFQKAKQDATKALDIDPNYRLVQRLLTAVENAEQ